MNIPKTKNLDAWKEYTEYLLAVTEALKAYAHHNGSCSVWEDSTECDCGLEELLT